MASSSSSRKNSTREHLLLTAAFQGDIQLVKKLAKELDDGGGGVAKVLNEVWDPFGKGVLHYAVSGVGKIPICEYLVQELNFDVNVQDGNGETPLHCSTLDGEYVTSAYLLDHGAKPNVVTDDGYTPLHFAAKIGGVAFVGKRDVLRLLINKGVKVDSQTSIGTALHVAAKHGVKDSVKFLLENHANPNAICHDVLPPLILAVQAKSIDCVRLLLEWGADPNVTSWGMTPLVAAVSERETEMIICLLTVGADPDKPDFWDRTPIEIAAMNCSHMDVMALYPEAADIEGALDIPGIFEYFHSDEAHNKRKLKREEKFWEAKAKGAEAVHRKHYKEAIHWYTEAISVKPTDAAVLSNRSLCWARLKDGDRAQSDAVACCLMKEDWPKAHYRCGQASLLLNDYRRAAASFGIALKLDPENKEIQEAYREAMHDYQAVMMDNMRNGHPYPPEYTQEDEAYAEYFDSIY